LFVAPRRSPSVVLATTVVLVTPLAALVAYGMNESSLSFGSARDVFGLPSVRVQIPLSYFFWPALFYGGLFIAAWIWLDRSERTRRLLADAELARSTAEAHLGQAQLQALQGQVDPALLLRVLAEVQQRYRVDPRGADRLLDLLVAFLRAAMPAVRSGTSTLADEVTLLRAYAALSEQLDGGRVRWQLCIDAPPPGLSFPPLLVLPLVERLASTAPDAATLAMVMHCDADSVALELHGAAPGWRDETLEYRLRVGLQGRFGDTWHLDVRDAPAPNEAALTLRLSLSAATPLNPAAVHSCSDASSRGEAPWTNPATTMT
jgi:hypothetical protein